MAVLDAAQVRMRDQAAAVSVDHGVALAPRHLLTGVVAARPAALCRLDTLAVDDGCGRAGLAPGALAVEHHEVVVERLPRSGVAADGEPAIDGFAWAGDSQAAVARYEIRRPPC